MQHADDDRLEPRATALPRHELAEVRAGVVERPALAREVAERHGAAPRERMTGRKHGQERVGGERDDRERGLARGGDALSFLPAFGELLAIKAMIGLDLTDWPADRPITGADLPVPVATPSSRTHAGLLRRLIERESLRIDELLLRPEILSAAHWQVVGTVDDAVEQIVEWSAAGAIDGFLAAPGGSVESLHCVLEQLVPRLVEAGLFRSRYTGTTFMEHLEESRQERVHAAAYPSARS